MIKIIGAIGEIKNIDNFLKAVSGFSKENNILIQAFDANVIFGKNHIISSVNHAKRAIERKTNTTNSLEMEILLYSSGERQLKLAIPKMGVKKGKTNIAFLLLNNYKSLIPDKFIAEFLKKLSLKRDDKIIEGDVKTLTLFGINEREIETVTKEKYGKLILEKVAMVDLIK
jgi:tRNA threonylcarbamoyladenosine modification (KEOPS) complex Cgi121 subunit